MSRIRKPKRERERERERVNYGNKVYQDKNSIQSLNNFNHQDNKWFLI